MYQVIGVKVILLTVGALSLLVFGFWYLIAQPSGIISLVSVALKSVSITATAILFTGQAFPIIPWLSKQKFVRSYLSSYLPDLNGAWRAQLASNWSTIASVHKLPEPDGPFTYADVKITVRLFTIRMELTSDSGYSESDTVAFRIVRSSEHGDVTMHYVYDDKTPQALQTDSGAHFGAANLKYKRKENRLPFLDGQYWTNRNWEKGLNTAGRIKMWRSSDPLSEANR